MLSRALLAFPLPAALLVAVSAPAPVAAQSAAVAAAAAKASTPMSLGSEYFYRFRVESDDDDDDMAGTVRVRNGVARIDVDNHDRGGEFLLVSADGRTLTVVHPKRREYEVSDADRFAQIAGIALKAIGPIVNIKLQDVKITPEALGPGPVVAGFPTRHYRLTQEFALTVGALGFKGEPEFHVVSTDYWVHPGLTLARNPLLELIGEAETALAQKEPEFVERSRAARAKLLSGTPLRMLVTSGQSKGEGDDVETKTRTIEITEIHSESQDARLFEVPEGFRRKEGISWNLGH
jgi:hypothetical protein